MKAYFIWIFLLAGIVGCKKEDPSNPFTQGYVVERNTTIPVPFAKIKLMNSVSSTDDPGDFTLEEVMEVQADESGHFKLPKSRDTEFVYAYTDPDTHFFNPTSTAMDYSAGMDNLIIPMIPYSWMKVRVQDEEPLNPEITTVWVSLDFKNELGQWEDMDSPDEFVIGRTFGAQKFILYYRLYTTPGEYELRWMETEFIPPHDTLSVMISY